ncbi:MAG: hypothetical protein AAF202_05500, partial [Pseudomonadota bacterium]
LADGSFDGLFAGSGRVSTQGLSLECDSVRISIETDDETYFNVTEWVWTCGGMTFANNPVEATLENGRVLVNGEDYGSMVNSTISMEIQGDGPNENFKLRASAFENSIEIREEYSSDEGQATFQANLPRVNLDGEGCSHEEDCVELGTD